MKIVGRALKLFLVMHSAISGENAVTYNLAGGRLGDQLIGYMHAKWISYKYDLPLLYKPFPYSDQLMLDSKEIKYTNKISNKFKVHKTLQVGQTIEQFVQKNDKNTLYIIPYFPESLEEYLPTENASCPVSCWKRPSNIANYFARFEVDWDDIEFRKLIRDFIRPKNSINLIELKSKLNVAIHVRKNSNGFDLPLLHGLKEFDSNQQYVDVVFPLKHPPEVYYTDQLKKLLQIFPDKKFYVFIFTDDQLPESIVNRFKNAVSDKNFEFDWRKSHNNHYSNVLEDLFSMTKFDVLIRPASNISIVASKLGNFKLVISPMQHHWEYTKLVIDKVEYKFQ